MGYYQQLFQSVFFIKAEDVSLAFEAVKELMWDHCREEADVPRFHTHSFSWLNGVEPGRWENLADAMEDWRFPIYVDEAGDVVSIDFTGEKAGDEEQLFAAIAPWVNQGCYIAMLGEDHAIWRWYFDGHQMIEQYGEVYYQ